MSQRISISLSNIAIILGLVLSLVLVWQIRSLLVVLMISVVLAASIAPLVNLLEKWRFPRWLGVVVSYLSIIGVLTGVMVIIGPTVFEQIERLLRQLPIFADTIVKRVETWAMNLNDTSAKLFADLFDAQALTSWLFRSSQQLVLRSYGITRGIVGAVVSIVLALFISGYMVADSRTLIRSFVQLFPTPWNDRLAAQASVVSHRMGGYIRGRLLVSGILGLAITTGLRFLGLADFSLALGAIAGVTNLIPFLGPILGSIPALIVAVSQGWWTFLWVLLLFVIIQNVETYLLDPLLVGSSVGVHPLYQLLAVLGGVQILGIIGALIVPPWFAGAAALVENLYLRPKLAAEGKLRGEALATISPTENTEEGVKYEV